MTGKLSIKFWGQSNEPTKFIHIAKGRRQRVDGFYVYYCYVVVSAVKFFLTLIR
jgi:hypothetical protein